MTGTTDMHIAFHPYGLSVCLNEKPKALVLHLKQYIKTRRKLGIGLIPITKTHFFIPKKPTKSVFHGYGSWYEILPNLSFGYGYETQT